MLFLSCAIPDHKLFAELASLKSDTDAFASALVTIASPIVWIKQTRRNQLLTAIFRQPLTTSPTR